MFIKKEKLPDMVIHMAEAGQSSTKPAWASHETQFLLEGTKRRKEGKEDRRGKRKPNKWNEFIIVDN